MARVRNTNAAHDGFLRHDGYFWLKLASAISLLAWLAYMLIDANPRPNGGTAYGYFLGVVSVGIILWLTALGIRKRNISRSKYSLKAWTSAHVYLGLSLIILATLHTGFQFGWNVHTLAYVAMMLVIGTGVFGIVAYARLPKAMSSNRGELTQPQMLINIGAIDRQLHDAAQPLDRHHSDIVRMSMEDSPVGGGVLRRLKGDQASCGTARALAALSEEVKTAGPLADKRLVQIVGLLERKSAALGVARRHVRLRTLLELWLYIHVPATFLLIAALVAHIISVFYYW